MVRLNPGRFVLRHYEKRNPSGTKMPPETYSNMNHYYIAVVSVFKDSA